jgi:glycosyltransferase involved in cell wall biosynthesis
VTAALPSNLTRSWHILTGEYPPASGGVGDYTERLAAGLAARGEEVHVWHAAPARPSAAVHEHPLPVGFGARGLGTVGRALDASRQRGRAPIILVQYVPNAFGMRGANVLLCLWLFGRRIRRRDDVRVMFHEPFYYFGRQSLRRNALALVHRGMAVLLLAASSVAYVSTESWMPLLSRYAASRRRFVWLPIPATVPTVSEDGITPGTSRAAAAAPNGFVVGHFSSYPADLSAELRQVVSAILDASGDVKVLLIGRNSDRFVRSFVADHPAHAARVTATGELRPPEIAAHLRACDVLVQPYPDGATTRRTSLMAPLACGVPTVTTVGRWSEPVWADASDVVELAPAGDAAAIVARCQALANDTFRRRALGSAAREFYERRFSLDRTLDVLCGTRGADESS